MLNFGKVYTIVRSGDIIPNVFKSLKEIHAGKLRLQWKIQDVDGIYQERLFTMAMFQIC